MSSVENITFEIECDCGKKATVTLDDVRKRKTITCKRCGTKMELSPDPKTKRDINRLNKKMKDLKKYLGDFDIEI